MRRAAHRRSGRTRVVLLAALQVAVVQVATVLIGPASALAAEDASSRGERATPSAMPQALRLDADRVQARVDELLAAYARNDVEAVLAMLDPRAVTVYGSDVVEFYTRPDEVRRMMRDDFRLWRSAEFGAPRDLSVRVAGELATAFFHVPFRAGGGREVVVRFATVWRRDGDRWLLTQSANTVPTTGSSAAELLERAAKGT